MTPPDVVIDHDHDEYAGIREVQAVQEKLLGALLETERRLSSQIAESDDHHEAEHDVIRATGHERHARLEQVLAEINLGEAVRSARTTGRSDAWGTLLLAARTLNEFRWLIGAVIVAALLAMGNLRVTLA